MHSFGPDRWDFFLPVLANPSSPPSPRKKPHFKVLISVSKTFPEDCSANKSYRKNKTQKIDCSDFRLLDNSLSQWYLLLLCHFFSASLSRTTITNSIPILLAGSPLSTSSAPVALLP